VFDEVYALARQIPRGRVTTYGALARALGMHHGARQVGWAMAVCDDSVPAHRVVNAQGTLSGHRGGVELRRALLEEEGVEFDAAGRIPLVRYFWEP
jgi:methylated-DNA-protein-cysteine methyltransferase related protein